MMHKSAQMSALGVNGGRNMGQGGGVTMYQWLGGSLST